MIFFSGGNLESSKGTTTEKYYSPETGNRKKLIFLIFRNGAQNASAGTTFPVTFIYIFSRHLANESFPSKFSGSDNEKYFPTGGRIRDFIFFLK